MTKVAIVTGGSRGIGRATALKLGALGYTVAVNYAANEAAANEVVNAITAKGGKPSGGDDGAGSGGGIYVTCDTFRGAGLVRAEGGAVTASAGVVPSSSVQTGPFEKRPW